MKISRLISELFYPEGIKCVICGDELSEKTRYPICDDCKVLKNTKFCLRCGRTMNNLADYCDECKEKTYNFDCARAPFIYSDGVTDLVYKLKFGGKKYVAETMAEFMADTFFENCIKADALTYVPLHHERKNARGYDQAYEIATAMSKLVDLQVEDTLFKVKKTKNLASLGKDRRAEEIADAFVVLPEAKISGRSFVLIDDVFTTGATVNECAKVLKQHKAKSVTVLTFATAKIIPKLY